LQAATSIKLLAATRRGPLGLYAWSDRIEKAVAKRVTDDVCTLHRGERFYVGKPIMITANDPILELANGDVGVVVDRAPESPTNLRVGANAESVSMDTVSELERSVAISVGGLLRHVPPARLDRVEPWWAMTIHKSQGSEFPDVVVALPEVGSRILTRELLYTAVTRARHNVTVLGSEAAVRAAVSHPVSRASGLRDRLAF
jgi:exodeoxyribonuclease V alpha subunit